MGNLKDTKEIKSAEEIFGKFKKERDRLDQLYPEWRQTYFDAGGMCQWIDVKAGRCDEKLYLWFHRLINAEQSMAMDGIPIRSLVLLCPTHHKKLHGGRLDGHDIQWPPNELHELVDLEAKTYGGWKNWLNAKGMIN